jgi:hypothetical protein
MISPSLLGYTLDAFQRILELLKNFGLGTGTAVFFITKV